MSAGAAVEALTLSLGTFRLKQVEFAVGAGEILVILGPNGAGKSVTLETIAGFHRPEAGRVLIAGREVTALPPERRRVGFVVQNFGLFPHLTVAQNVSIARRADRPPIAAKAVVPSRGDAADLLGYFGIAHLAQRAPPDLSVGEKQRVALARALAGAPDLFLFDEPFSALDAQTRGQLREELGSFLRALAIPAIFVSHDRVDALVLADKIVVLHDGAVVQSGSAAQVFETPASAFVARFIGVENVLRGRLVEASDEFLSIEVGKQTLRACLPGNPEKLKKQAAPGCPISLSIRAEEVTVCRQPPERAANPTVNRFEARIERVRHEGALVTLGLDCGFPLKAHVLAPQARALNLAAGAMVVAEIAATAIHAMPD
ncbi:MAG: ABC transporter ATP-binding protein [Xanthobacteraceae bacterium]